MKRLTVFDGEFWLHKDFPPVREDTVDEFVDCVKDMASRLAFIENILGDDYDLGRLKELLQADRDGRCVVLPCRVGDTLYYIGGTYKTLIKPATVEEVYIGDGVFAVGVSSGFTTFTLQEKEWYKSKKEAEAALERMEGEEE